MTRIFLCHASEDKDCVREVYRWLRSIPGIEPWLDEENLLPGQDWASEIARALRNSDFILIFLSQISVSKRGYVQREMKMALDAWQDIPEGGIHTIPVRINECEVPESFQRYQYVNLFEQGAFDRVIRALRFQIRKSTSPLLEPHIQTDEQWLSDDSDPVSRLKRDKPGILKNSIGMEFVLICAGQSTMGAPYSDQEAEPSERPTHRVIISQPFYLSRYAVTEAQWIAVMGKSKRRNVNHAWPANLLSWEDAMAFMDVLAQREGRMYKYFLPTEAQWEYACKAGTEGSRYHPILQKIAWFEANSRSDPQPVGGKWPNPWGLFDMLGNVMEMCADGYRIFTPDTVIDPIGDTSPSAQRALRGGSHYHSAAYIRASDRQWIEPHVSDFLVGFRCAMQVN